jgi:hypothetical protein
MKNVTLYLILIALSLSCTSNISEPILIEIEEDFSSIENPKERWEAYNLEDYYIEQKWACECSQPYGAEIFVKENKVLDVNFSNHTLEGRQTNFDGAFSRITTINEAFQLIDEYQSRADSIFVEYSPKYGYPTRLIIDKSFVIADEEIRYNFRGLKKIIQF